MCKTSESSPPTSMLVHEATVCQSVSFIWASKGFVIELVCWSVMGQGKLKSGLVVLWGFNADP